MKELSRTDFIKFMYRSVILLVALLLVIFGKQTLIDIFNYEIIRNIHTYTIIWLIMVIIMLKAFIPVFSNKIASGKIFKRYYKKSIKGYKEEQLNLFTNKSNMGAIKSAIFYFLQLATIGFLHYLNLISDTHLYLFCVLFYWLDGFYIYVWCPYRKMFIKNKCCNSCRIYNWGYFMVVAPLIFINSFYTYSLIIISLLIIVQWETMHFIKPERFSEISNENLKCNNCSRNNCTYKRK